MIEQAYAMSDRVVMITGASSGIGAAAARLFAEHGAAVVLTARRREQLASVVREIEAKGGRAAYVTGDIRHGEDVERVVATAVERLRSDPSLRQGLVEAGRKRAEHFSIERTGPHWIDTLTALMKETS